jgi:hypothetical protein
MRNTENSDGCSAVVLGKMVVDPRARRRDTGTATLLPWLEGEGNRDSSPAASDRMGESVAYPTFELGSWRFTVKTKDLHLVEDLKAFVRDIIDLPRADAKFTFKLVHCTEDGRLAGWAWQKERVQGS